MLLSDLWKHGICSNCKQKNMSEILAGCWIGHLWEKLDKDTVLLMTQECYQSLEVCFTKTSLLENCISQKICALMVVNMI